MRNVLPCFLLFLLLGCDTHTPAPQAPIASLTLNIPSSIISVGQGLLVDVKAYTETGDLVEDPDLTWSSSAPTIAGFNPDLNRVTGLAQGFAIITATHGDLIAQDSVRVYDLSGVWEGTGTFGAPWFLAPTSQTIRLTLAQDKTKLTGTFENLAWQSNGTDAGQGPIAGTTSNNRFTHEIVAENSGGCVFSMNGFLTVRYDGTADTWWLDGGQWNATADCGSGQPFTWPMSVPMNRVSN